MPTNTRRFFTDGHVCVLTLTVSAPDGLSDAQDKFYSPLTVEFERAVENRFFPLAKAAYSDCTDRRKRWRYTPWQAHFCLTRKDDELFLCISSNQTVHVKEAHSWHGDTLARRKKLT